MKSVQILLLILALIQIGCNDDDTAIHPPEEVTYFPDSDENWQQLNTDSMGWDHTAIESLYTLLEENGTRGFVVLIDGKIALENYWGKGILNINPFTKKSDWYWASAGKTLTAFAIMKAQEEGFLSLSDKTSDHLGKGWTACTPQQEDAITIWHQMTMTSGLDDGVNDPFNTKPENLIYNAAPGTRWAYHNAPYTLLDTVVTSATNTNFDTYFKNKLRDKIGMNGYWTWLGDNHVYFSTPKSMARFGHLILHNGKWKEEQLLAVHDIVEMTTKSQDLNEAYGYLWWLNGQNSYMLPGSQLKLSGSLFPDAPSDAFAGLGKNGQYLCIVPSKKMVLVRMGDNPDQSLVPAAFLNDIWKKLNEVMN
jgi:CubicO group peptidase (beta-lactamase class C family)